ncbi:low affinity immunoglobulin gamma Fc region receptor II-like isoform X2 [Oreochromis aureus]|uniref:Immunoglobulin domain-containing protein n=1 Tax=Oreochromis aureus TaxID=47969 RepID=A0AAZ1X5V0_OREAU|nr:low affinity immunoglobulin gamma Fc region receptor II-like isoform X2 [Oreochromis aureus]
MMMVEFILLGTQVQQSCTWDQDVAVPRVTPNRLQHFEYESVSLHCDGSTQLKGFRNNETFNPACVTKKTSSGSSCVFDRVYQVDSGEYWCQAKGGESSNTINITVTGGSVILDSPALVVLEGSSVTLLCRNKTASINFAFFYKDDVILEKRAVKKINIYNFSKLNEGLYKCSIPDVGQSPESWLAMKELPVSPQEDTRPHGSDYRYVIGLLWTAIFLLIMTVVILQVRFLHTGKGRDDSNELVYSSLTICGAQQSCHLAAEDDFKTIVVYSAMSTDQNLTHVKGSFRPPVFQSFKTKRN